MIQVTFLDLESKSPSEILACDHRRSFFPFCFGGEGFFFFFFPLRRLYPRKKERLIVDSIVSRLLKHLKRKIKLKNVIPRFDVSHIIIKSEKC